jgi:hypothetical protein
MVFGSRRTYGLAMISLGGALVTRRLVAGKGNCVMKRRPSFDHDINQVPVLETTATEVMASPEFGVGVMEVRTGQAPRFDEMNHWNYERGRLWATLAPTDMSPDSRKAVLLMEAAFLRKFVI